MKPTHRSLAQFCLCTLLLAAYLLALGCATNTGNPAKDRAGRVTNALLKNVAQAVGKAAFDELVSRVSDSDHAYSAADGLWKEGLWSVSANLVSSTLVSDVVNAYSGRSLPHTAAVAATAFRDAAPATVEDQKALVSVMAAAISEAAKSEAAP